MPRDREEDLSRCLAGWSGGRRMLEARAAADAGGQVPANDSSSAPSSSALATEVRLGKSAE